MFSTHIKYIQKIKKPKNDMTPILHYRFLKHIVILNSFLFLSINNRRPTSRSTGTSQNQNGGVTLPAGIADDQSKDFDFEKTEMKYDSTGMFHWSPAKSLEDCILVTYHEIL